MEKKYLDELFREGIVVIPNYFSKSRCNNIISEINNSLTSKLSNEMKIKNWDGKTSERIFNILYK